MIGKVDRLHEFLRKEYSAMSCLNKEQSNEARLDGEEIRVAIGYRIYELFCADCNRVLIEEDSKLMRLQCSKCKRIYAFRLHPEQEDYIFRASTGGITVQ